MDFTYSPSVWSRMEDELREEQTRLSNRLREQVYRYRPQWVAPVTRRSGTRCVVHMRHACSARLRTALYHAARVSAQCDARSREVYTALRGRGHTHGRACCSVADRMLRILVAMLRAGTLYAPAPVRLLDQPAAPCAA